MNYWDEPLTINQVKQLIKYAEIEVSGKSPHERIDREEMERIAELGKEELLRLQEESLDIIFNTAMDFIQRGDIANIERQYQRLESRESCLGSYALAVEIALYLYKEEYSEIKTSIEYINKSDYIDRVETLKILKRVLQYLYFEDEIRRARVENLITVCENTDYYAEDPERYAGHGKAHNKHMDKLQRRTMYIATVVKNEIQNSKFHHSLLKGTHFDFPMKLEPIIRNAIYTALYAEKTYDELASSKLFIDGIRSQTPRWWEPAKLLKKIPKNVD